VTTDLAVGGGVLSAIAALADEDFAFLLEQTMRDLKIADCAYVLRAGHETRASKKRLRTRQHQHKGHLEGTHEKSP
jgi:ABC-type branched-subunit amino acid transport system ATPase component